jgi:hypothetical protein
VPEHARGDVHLFICLATQVHICGTQCTEQMRTEDGAVCRVTGLLLSRVEDAPNTPLRRPVPATSAKVW